MSNCKHFWLEIASNKTGRPIKYKCIDCLTIWTVKQDADKLDSFTRKSYILDRINKNLKTAELIKKSNIGHREQMYINHLTNENNFLENLYIRVSKSIA